MTQALGLSGAKAKLLFAGSIASPFPFIFSLAFDQVYLIVIVSEDNSRLQSNRAIAILDPQECSGQILVGRELMDYYPGGMIQTLSQYSKTW